MAGDDRFPLPQPIVQPAAHPLEDNSGGSTPLSLAKNSLFLVQKKMSVAYSRASAPQKFGPQPS
jgi:hypothetical protein